MKDGKYVTYTKEQKAKDQWLGETIERHYKKMVKMERTKYKKPMMSEALTDLAKWLGCEKPKNDDFLDRGVGLIETTSDEESAENGSLFSKFTVTKRPKGHFGRQVGEANQNSGEVEISPSPL